MEGQGRLFSTEEYETGESFTSKLYDQIVERAAFVDDVDGLIEEVIAEMVPDMETAWALIELLLKENEGIFAMGEWGEQLKAANRLELLHAMLFTQILDNVVCIELPAEKWLKGKYPDCKIVDPIGWCQAELAFDEPISHERFMELYQESEVIEPNL